MCLLDTLADAASAKWKNKWHNQQNISNTSTLIPKGLFPELWLKEETIITGPPDFGPCCNLGVALYRVILMITPEVKTTDVCITPMFTCPCYAGLGHINVGSCCSCCLF